MLAVTFGWSWSAGLVFGTWALLTSAGTNTLVAASIVSIVLNPLIYRSIKPFERWLTGHPWLSKRLNPVALSADVSSASPTAPMRTVSARHRAVVVGYGPTGGTVVRLLQESGIVRGVQSMSTAQDYSAYLEGARRAAWENLARLVDSHGPRLAGVRHELRKGDLEQVLPELVVAEGADLVVIGSMGRSGLARHLMGNPAERVVSRVPCSLLVVKPDGFVSSMR